MADDSSPTTWTQIELIELGPGESRKGAMEDFYERHPELCEKLDWVRVDLFCGRDGFGGLRFMISDQPPVKPAPRRLP